MPADDKGDFATPRVDEAGPAAVNGDVLTVSGKETDGGVIEGLARVLQNWRREEGIRKEHQATATGAEGTRFILAVVHNKVNWFLKGMWME